MKPLRCPPVYPSSAPLVCFQEYKKDFRYTFLISYFLIFGTSHINLFTTIYYSLTLCFYLILSLICCEAIEMPYFIYPSSAPLVCFQENKKDFSYTFLFFYFLIFVTGHIDVFTAINNSLNFSLANFATNLRWSHWDAPCLPFFCSTCLFSRK